MFSSFKKDVKAITHSLSEQRNDIEECQFQLRVNRSRMDFLEEQNTKLAVSIVLLAISVSIILWKAKK